jgi:Domain of unknown function (DUF4168)
MTSRFRTPLLLAILSATALGGSLASAQQTAPEPADSTAAQTAPPVAPTPIDEQKIDKFAEAYVAVQTIQTQAAQELDAASNDPAKQQQKQAAVENEMIAAVERTGLKLDEFNGIVQTMTADADLRAKVVAKIKERQGG